MPNLSPEREMVWARSFAQTHNITSAKKRLLTGKSFSSMLQIFNFLVNFKDFKFSHLFQLQLAHSKERGEKFE